MDFFKILNGGIGVSMSNFDRLWAKKYSGWPETELTGLLPLSFLSKGEALTDYRIYGTENGAGVQTENLFNVSDFISNYVAGSARDINGEIVPSIGGVSGYSTYTIPVNQNQIYYLRGKTKASISDMGGFRLYFLDSDLRWICRTDLIQQFDETSVYEFTTPANTSYLQIQTPVLLATPDIRLMITSTAPTSYIPYGYKIPILNMGNNLFDTDAKDTDKGYVDGSYIDQNGALTTPATGWAVSEYITVSPNTNYKYINSKISTAPSIAEYNNNDSVVKANTIVNGVCEFTTASSTTKIRVSIYKSKANITTLQEQSNYDLFIGDSKLGEEEYLDYGEQKVWKKPTPTIYGWHVDPSISNPAQAITYLGDAVGKTPAAMGASTFSYGDWSNAFFMPRPCMVKSDGTVDYYLDPNDYTKKLDGTASDVADASYDGNAMMEWPLIWWKYEAGETEGEGYFYVSNVKIDNTYNCYCNVNCDNQIVEHFYTAIYNGTTAPAYSSSATYAVDDLCTQSGGLYKCITAVETAESFDATKWELVNSVTPLRSISGLALTSANGNGSTTYSQESTRAMSNNTTAKTEWFIDVWSDRMLINGLLILMGKSLNSQATFGRGLDSGSQAAKEAYVTGALNDKGLFWGSTSSGTYGVKVFGMENWYSCVWHRTAGLIGLANGNTAYKMTYGTADGTTANGYNTTGDGYHINTIARPSSNYVKSCKFGDFGYLPLSTTGGSASTYYTDYWYTNNSALTFALVGGNSGYGAYGGVSCVVLANGAGNAGWSIAAALTLKPLAKQPYSPPLTPTDPPAPLPTINTYKGENTLSSEESVGEVTIKGRIKETT